MPIIDAKTMLNVSSLYKLRHKKLLRQWLAFSGPHSKISRLFQHLNLIPYLLYLYVYLHGEYRVVQRRGCSQFLPNAQPQDNRKVIHV